jgi:anionic cell wall polymer biosynthesis LytR-Cps2A-Psr (LCP) family protein
MAGHRRRRSGRWMVVLGVVAGILAVGSAGAFAGLKVLGNRYEGAVKRADLLGGAAPPEKPGHADPPKVTGPMTFLLIGSDSRAGANANPDTPDGNIAAIGGQRSDVIILVHIPKSTNHAYVISIPRDSYIPIYTKNGKPGDRNKINAAFAWGGAPRLVQTLNGFTGQRIDYPVIVDFAAIRKLTDLVGGVDVVIDKTSKDGYRFLPADSRYPTTPCTDTHGHAQHCLVFKAGTAHLDGQLAEYYVRQRKGLPSDDFDRAKRHQQYLRALMVKLSSGDTLTNPFKLDELIRTMASSLTVDKRMPVQSLAYSLKDLRAKDLTFMTMPISDEIDVPGKGSVMVPDKRLSAELFAALRGDTLDQYVLKHPPNDVTHGR